MTTRARRFLHGLLLGSLIVSLTGPAGPGPAAAATTPASAPVRAAATAAPAPTAAPARAATTAGARGTEASRATPIPIPAAPPPRRVPVATDLDAAGGAVELLTGRLGVPAGALAARARFASHAVADGQAGNLRRHHPLARALHVEAADPAGGARVTRLGRPVTLLLALDGPEIPPGRLTKPGARLRRGEAWEPVPSTYDPTTRTLSVELAELPATVAAVDESQAEVVSPWDPYTPSTA
jgi:hypothetical protein